MTDFELGLINAVKKTAEDRIRRIIPQSSSLYNSVTQNYIVLETYLCIKTFIRNIFLWDNNFLETITIKHF